EIRRQRAGAVELGGEPRQHVGPPAGEDELAAARVKRPRDRLAQAASGAGEQDVGAGDLHRRRRLCQRHRDRTPRRGDTGQMHGTRGPPPAGEPAIVALFGPTGVGKTAIAVALAQLLRARGEHPVAVSADALQVYSGLETLTGVASASERASLEHRLVSFLPVDARFSVGEYAQLAHAEIDRLIARGRRPILVGGTGLYLRAALTTLNLRPPPRRGSREHWQAQIDRRASPALHALLARRAPWAAAGIEPNDRRRVVRALELLDTGELKPANGPSQLWSAELRHATELAGLTMAREALYRLIDARVEEMLAAG